MTTKKNLIVSLTNSKYLIGNIVLYNSLLENGMKTEFLLLYNELTDMDKRILSSYGIKLQHVDNIENPYKGQVCGVDNKVRNVFNKLHCWRLTDYNKIIYIDNDILNMKNFEDLFNIEVNEEEIVASMAKTTDKNINIFNSGFFMIKPSMRIYTKLLVGLTNKINSFNNSDQGFLNTFFKNNIKYIIDEYNLSKRRKTYDINKIINLHFVGMPKPWMQNGERGYERYNNMWIQKYRQYIDKYWKQILGNELQELNDVVYDNKYKVEGNLLYNHNLATPSEKIRYNGDLKRNKLYEIVKNKKNILEIGVNGGHSALIMLKSNPNIHYYGFDINWHPYTQKAVNYLKTKYNNINYIIGDSEKTIPNFKTDIKFDIIHIDGGHDIQKAYNDIMNCKRLSNENTLLIFDDLNIVPGIGIKLLQLWNTLIKKNIIKEVQELNTYQSDYDNKIAKYIF